MRDGTSYYACKPIGLFFVRLVALPQSHAARPHLRRPPVRQSLPSRCHTSLTPAITSPPKLTHLPTPSQDSNVDAVATCHDNDATNHDKRQSHHRRPAPISFLKAVQKHTRQFIAHLPSQPTATSNDNEAKPSSPICLESRFAQSTRLSRPVSQSAIMGRGGQGKRAEPESKSSGAVGKAAKVAKAAPASKEEASPPPKFLKTEILDPAISDAERSINAAFWTRFEKALLQFRSNSINHSKIIISNHKPIF